MRKRRTNLELAIASIPEAVGVYAIVCDETPVYVGGSVRMRSRLDSHHRALRGGLHPSLALQELWLRRGYSSRFSCRVLEFTDREHLRAREAHWAQMHTTTLLNSHPAGCSYRPSLRDTAPTSGDKRVRGSPEWQKARLERCRVLGLPPHMIWTLR